MGGATTGGDGSARALRRAGLALLAAFAALVALRLHGFSLPYWHAVLDDSAQAEVLLGESRALRSDDWMVSLPLAMAQRAHDPPFPTTNRNVGLGQDMLFPLATPVAHPLAPFRPTLWGWFAGDDVGLAWQWWSQALGLAFAWFAALLLVGEGAVGLAALGAALVVVAPFFQFWSLNPAPHAASAALVFAGAAGVARARTPRAILAGGLLLGWAGGVLAATAYPSFAVPLAWLVVALTAGWLAAARALLPWRERLGWRGAAALAAAVLAGAAVLALYTGAHEAIAATLASRYPGRRVSLGGDRPLWDLLAVNLGVPLFTDDVPALHNLSEAGAFLFLSPPLAACWAWRAVARRERDPLALALCALCAALFLYVCVGVPEPVARATGLSLAPGRRAVVALGLADVSLLVRTLARAPVPGRTGRALAGAIALAWCGVLAACAVRLAGALPQLPAAGLAAAVAANGALAFAALRGRRPRAVLAAAVALSAASSLWFNPLVRGGAAFLREHELSRAVLALDAATEGGSTWLVLGEPAPANLVRALGVRALNGTHPTPQLALWRRVDPRGRSRPVYDRYAHVTVVATAGAPRFRLRTLDGFRLELDPCGPAFAALGATHVLLYGGGAEEFAALSGFEHLARIGKSDLFRVDAHGCPPDR
jgi:hypothetical protein